MGMTRSEEIIKDWHNAKKLYLEQYPDRENWTLSDMMVELLYWMKLYSKI